MHRQHIVHIAHGEERTNINHSLSNIIRLKTLHLFKLHLSALLLAPEWRVHSARTDSNNLDALIPFREFHGFHKAYNPVLSGDVERAVVGACYAAYGSDGENDTGLVLGDKCAHADAGQFDWVVEVDLYCAVSVVLFGVMPEAGDFLSFNQYSTRKI